MSKNLLFISYHFPPAACSGVFRTIRFSKYLPANHWNPVILTVAPSMYESETPLDRHLLSSELRSLRVNRTGAVPGMQQWIRWVRKIFPSKSPSPVQSPKSRAGAGTRSLQRFKDAITIAGFIPDRHNTWIPNGFFRGILISRKTALHAIYASGPPFSSFLIGLLLKRYTHLPLVLDFRDPWLQNPYSESLFNFQEKANRRLEWACIAYADRVIANTDELREALIRRYPFKRSETFVTITNGYDETEFAAMDLRRPGHSGGPVIISHIGGIYSKRNPEPFMAAVSSLIRKGVIDRDRLIIKFVGHFGIPGFQEELAHSLCSSCVHFCGHLSKEAALKTASESDALLLIQPDTALQIPGKLFEYIRLQIPIFAVCGPGATRSLMEANHLGTLAEGNVTDIEEKLHIFYNDLLEKRSLERREPGAILDQRILQFEARSLAARLTGVLNELS